jgi:HEAT repeat protein
MEQTDIAKTIAEIRDYDYARHTTALLAVEKLINDTHSDPALRGQIEADLARLLQSAVPFACKQFICQKLWIIGTTSSLPVLEAMLGSADVHVVEAACYALSRHASSSANRVVQEGLHKAKGSGLVPVIDLAGDRRDPECAAKLAELAQSSDGPTADAAIAALGKIASADAIRTLAKLHAEGQDARRVAAAHALLQGAQELAARGNAAEARGVYQQLTGNSEAPWIRRGALLALAAK